MKPMIIDISKIKSFNTSLFHEMIEYKDNIIVVGSNLHIEKCMEILGIDKIIRHEKDPEVVKSILTDAS
jgi:hypothetical protein